VRREKQIVPAPILAQILLLVHVRVLLQSLRHRLLPVITRYQLLFDDWRGYLVAGFSLVWLANIYMSFFGRLRLEIREDRMEIAAEESRERSTVRNVQNDSGNLRGPPS
jgi:hypothetical protein